MLTQTLIDHLTGEPLVRNSSGGEPHLLTVDCMAAGESDGVAKDPSYIFKVYMALENYEMAARAALVIAKNQQDQGKYKLAHGVLYEMHRELRGASSVLVASIVS